MEADGMRDSAVALSWFEQYEPVGWNHCYPGETYRVLNKSFQKQTFWRRRRISTAEEVKRIKALCDRRENGLLHAFLESKVDGVTDERSSGLHFFRHSVCLKTRLGSTMRASSIG